MKKLDFATKVAEMSIKYNVKVPNSERMKVADSQTMSEAFYSFYDKDTIGLNETAYAMMLNNSLKMLGIICIGVGSSKESVLDIRKAMQAALLSNATMIAICHNHPSYSLFPSKMDDQVTMKLQRACENLDIKLIDHIILDPEGNYYSFSDNGRI